jgi:hypothetical protein
VCLDVIHSSFKKLWDRSKYSDSVVVAGSSDPLHIAELLSLLLD